MAAAVIKPINARAHDSDSTSKQPALVSQLDDFGQKIWLAVQGLPCVLAVEIPIPNFTVGDLLRLDKGTVIESHCNQGLDIPLRVNGEPIGWAEFEIMGERLAVRITDLE